MEPEIFDPGILSPDVRKPVFIQVRHQPANAATVTS